ncbi:MAG TPA: hypothetical protein VFI68_02765 [Anaerolineales bacterium]|nr:hypothetical protein [Anaerolineales bacterium]
MNLKSYLIGLVILTLTSCSIPVDVAPQPTSLTAAPTTPQSTLISSSTFTPIPALTQPSTLTATLSAPASAPSFCDDPRGRELIKSFSAAIASKDGQVLASLISPSKGLDVRFYRDGNAVNYDAEHAKFVFETTFQADWGLSFGSGDPTLGSFQEIVLPSLQQVFTSNAVIVCNQLKVGGATYQPVWPYAGMNYFSVHFPGTDQNGGLDWQTWALGMDNVAGMPFLAALVHYVWEP